MVWKIKFDKRAEKKFAKFDKQIQKRIKDFLDKKLAIDPYSHSTLLVNSDDFFRSRIGDYRIIFKLNNKELIIILLDIGHRREIYKLNNIKVIK